MHVPRTRTVIARSGIGGALLCASAAFSQAPAPAPAPSASLASTLATIATTVAGAQPVIVYQANVRFEAPNWTRDGRSLVFDQGGKMKQIPVAGGEPVDLNIGGLAGCSGSHGFSPDGKVLAVTCRSQGLTGFHVFLVPSGGGDPKLLTHMDGSFWHSWSPDGKTILFTHPENGSGNFYSIAVDGTSERALTSGTGISDDPDFSPDGKYIYFNSDRGGSMQIWRMRSDGTSPEQVTSDNRVNWTPHVSPTGRQMVYTSYEPGTAGHPANRNIVLKIMSLPDRSTRDLITIVGGTGTMNVPSWDPTGEHFAFVSYRVLETQP